MRKQTLSYLKCPVCQAELECDSKASEVASGAVRCLGCGEDYPILAGVLILVEDVGGYLLEHVKGVSRYVEDKDIPKAYRSDFSAARRELVHEHIEEDLEAERVTALYLMTHYLSAKDVQSPDPVIAELIAKHWDHGPFSRIRELVRKAARPSLIELGCGVGGLYAALRSDVKSYLGLDSSFASIVLARHLALGLPLKEKLKVPHDLLAGTVSREVRIVAPKPETTLDADFVVCDLAVPPVRAGLWDMSAALNVIDMLPEPRELPRLQHELVRKGGTAIQSCPYIWHADVAERLRRTLPPGTSDSARAVEQLYEEADFEITHSEAHVPWLFFKNLRQLELYSVHLFSARTSSSR